MWAHKHEKNKDQLQDAKRKHLDQEHSSDYRKGRKSNQNQIASASASASAITSAGKCSFTDDDVSQIFHLNSNFKGKGITSMENQILAP